MKSFTKEEAAAWLQDYGIHVDKSWEYPDVPLDGYFSLDFPQPNDSGRKVALARMFFNDIEDGSRMLVWLRDRFPYKSGGHFPLLMRFRQALKEFRPLDETLCHLFDNEEKDDAMSLVVMSLLFFWDCYAIDVDNECAFYTSHDEFCTLLTKSPDMYSEYEGTLKKMGFLKDEE